MRQGLTIADLEDLLEDIKVYLELEQGKNVEYWRDIITIASDELSQLRKLDSSQRGTINPSAVRPKKLMNSFSGQIFDEVGRNLKKNSFFFIENFIADSLSCFFLVVFTATCIDQTNTSTFNSYYSWF